MPRPERLCNYDNLVYACCQCNALKQEAPPVLNPCEEALGQHLEIQTDGSVLDCARSPQRFGHITLLLTVPNTSAPNWGLRTAAVPAILAGLISPTQ
jgi:hypothetical protein